MMNSAELFANLQGGKAGCSIAIASDVNAADDRIGSVRCPNVPSGQYTGAKGAYITREFMQGYTGTRWFVLQTQAIYFYILCSKPSGQADKGSTKRICVFFTEKTAKDAQLYFQRKKTKCPQNRKNNETQRLCI